MTWNEDRAQNSRYLFSTKFMTHLLLTNAIHIHVVYKPTVVCDIYFMLLSTYTLEV